MKKRFLPVAAIVLSSSLLFSSCIGSFALSNKLLAWNQTIDNKFVNELVFLGLWIVPVYEISALADILVINSIEFWSGNNPVEAGIVKKVQGENGIYTVETLENGYDVKDENGHAAQFIYNKETNTWSLVENEKSTKVLTFVDSENAIVYLPNGAEQKVAISEAGVLAFRQSIDNAYHLAVK